MRNKRYQFSEAMGKPAKWMIVLGAVVVALPLLAVMFFYVFLNGGIYGTILTMKPRPNLESPGTKRDRARLEADLDGAFQRVSANMDFARYEESKHDVCYSGENSFMRSEGYANRCTLQVTRFYGFDGDFRQKMIDFEKRIIVAGRHFGLGNGDGRDCFPNNSMEYYMLNYYDVRPNVTVDQNRQTARILQGPVRSQDRVGRKEHDAAPQSAVAPERDRTSKSALGRAELPEHR